MFWTCENCAIKGHYRLRKKYTHMETYTSRIATLQCLTLDERPLVVKEPIED